MALDSNSIKASKELGHTNDLSSEDEKLEGGKVEEFEGVKTESQLPVPRFTKEEEEAVIRKLDWHLMPLIFVLYSLSVLDRSNLGNAKIAGMQDDIDLGGNRYSWLGTIFYISCQLPRFIPLTESRLIY
jgi:hypothetical protein